ncbi:MAG TPA: HAD-IC family P-type ATPase, partial [Candidatus Protoclostridium stercorigallinarum]|nr:HAD-IC family P-type ATPase [Candidatus Protoclostridium stercorigallinarum]
MDICEKYGTCPGGLDSAEAERRRTLYGDNVTEKRKAPSLARRMARQLKDPMLIILLGAAAVGLALAIADFSAQALVEPLLIIGIALANALVSALQERGAQRSLDALENLSAVMCKVRRDGKEIVADARTLVPGDIVLLHAGDIVPADCVLIGAHSLESEESMLTGESVPVSKSEGDRVFSGSKVLTGKGTAVVDKTGMSTEMGRIAALLNAEGERPTPLQSKLKKLSEQLGVLSLVICFVVFALGLAGIFVLGNRELTPLMLLTTAIALAVSALPEGLPTTVTMVLSSGMRKLVARRAIVRKLPAVETLGSVSVICTDKTGTLTEGRMTVTEYTDRRTLELAALCTDNASDPTDAALMDVPRPEAVRLSLTPFDNVSRKMSVTVNVGGKILEITKGAPESVYPPAAEAAAALEERGLRVLAVACRELRSPDDLRGGRQTFVGLVGLSDPPRPEAAEAVRKCKSAGIRPVMLTGDGAGAARSVAAAVGLDAERVLLGRDIEHMSDEELKEALKSTSVFARVTPSDKLRIVKLFRSMGEVVGVTGDGV